MVLLGGGVIGSGGLWNTIRKIVGACVQKKVDMEGAIQLC